MVLGQAHSSIGLLYWPTVRPSPSVLLRLKDFFAPFRQLDVGAWVGVGVCGGPQRRVHVKCLIILFM